jgi:carboxypeptidase C (cathepsin A)
VTRSADTGNVDVHYGYGPERGQYSGYITVNASSNGQLFFWSFESRSNPLTDPVILWMTGGPGYAPC